MENLSDMYHLFRFIAERIFFYLRDMILHEFSGIAGEINEEDPSEMKTRPHPFTRRAIADFVAFFTICAFFGSFVILSAKCVKGVDSNDNPPPDQSPRPVTVETEGEPLEMLEEDDYTIAQSTLENSRRNPWGDADPIIEPEIESTFTRLKFGPRNRSRNHSSIKNHQSNSSICELRTSQSQHSQSTQTSNKIIQRATNERDWLIRRTRSGHIYGKYPL